MTRVLESFPPPDLSYPPEGSSVGWSIPPAETSYLRTRLPDDAPSNLQEPDDEFTGFVSVVKRFIPEKNGVRACSICGYVRSLRYL